MRSAHWFGFAVLACGFIFANAAKAALQVALGEVNTSVGIKPTTTANKWKLQTDPEIDPLATGPNLDLYIPTQGSLSNSYDPTKFTLAVNPSTNTYGLGDTVEGLGAYEVIAFDVAMKGGGFIDVHANPTPGGPDLITLLGNTSGGEAGQVLNVLYQLIPDRKADALPADVDQLFYEINLVQIGTNPNFDPGVVTTFGNVNSFLTIAPKDPTNPNPPITTTFSATGGVNGGPTILPSSNVPEPTSMTLLGIAALGLLARTRKLSAAGDR